MIVFDAKETMASQAAAKCEGGWAWRRLAGPQRARLRGLTGFAAVLTLLFIKPLIKLMLYADQSNLQSYILLVPFISGYLFYVRRRQLLREYRSSILGSFTLGGIGIAALTAASRWHGTLSLNDELTLLVLAYVSGLAAGGFLFLGWKWMSVAAFPIAFLFFMLPLPDAMVIWLENVSANASAEIAALYFNMLGTPLVRHGRIFELPSIVLQVAQECSGIHSSLVLFVTSLIASELFLKTRWKRIVLIAFVIPLGILRNGFRILVIGLLCVHVGPQMINSRIHRHGGPIFFALSLVPLFLLLIWLRRHELKNLADEDL